MLDYMEYEAEAKKTLKMLKQLKKKGVSEKSITVDGLINYCNKLIKLCMIIKKMNEEIYSSQNAHDSSR